MTLSSFDDHIHIQIYSMTTLFAKFDSKATMLIANEFFFGLIPSYRIFLFEAHGLIFFRAFLEWAIIRG
jgi:hypothetical protein